MVPFVYDYRFIFPRNQAHRWVCQLGVDPGDDGRELRGLFWDGGGGTTARGE